MSQDANQAYLREKLTDAHEYAAEWAADPHMRRCIVIGTLISISRMAQDEADRLFTMIEETK